MTNYQPGDFGENSTEKNGETSTFITCPHCSKTVEVSATVCPHCNLPLDEIIEVDLFPIFPRQRLRRMMKPQTILVAVVSVAMVLGLYGFFVVQQYSSDYYIEKGDRLIAEGDIVGAAQYYTQAVQSSPQDPVPYEKLGWAEYQLARDSEALNHFEDALSLSSDRILSLYGAGIAAYQLRDYEKSISYLNRVIEIESGYVGAYEHLGLAEYRLGKYESAFEHLNRAWIYNPQNATTLYYLARILTQWGETEAAIETFNQAEKLGFESGSIAHMRGLTYMQVGNYEFARDDLQKALISFPSREDVVLSLGKALYLLEDYSGAKNQLLSLQADVPVEIQPEYLALSGWISLRQGYYDAARDNFNLWLNLNPNDEQALNALGWAAHYSGKCQTAVFYFESAIQTREGDWVIALDSLSAIDETPQNGLTIQCQDQ